MHYGRLCRRWGFCMAVMCASAVAAAAEMPVKRTFHEIHMGVDVTLTLYGGTEAAANDAARLAFARIAELNQIFSDYDAESETMRLCRTATVGEPVTVSQDLWFVLNHADELCVQSHGAFDVTIGPVSKLWRRARRRYQLPDPQELAEARARVGRQGYQLQPEHHQITLRRNDLQLDFGGLVKGYAAEAAYRKLQQAGFSQSLVAIAGDLFAGAAPPDQPGWRIGIAPLKADSQTPSRWLCLQHAAVSTSGDAFQFVEIDGQRYSHIVDPRSGIGLTQRCSVTVVAEHGIDADAWATTACVLGPEHGLTLLTKANSAEALFLFLKDELPQTSETAGFARLLWAEPGE